MYGLTSLLETCVILTRIIITRNVIREVSGDSYIKVLLSMYINTDTFTNSHFYVNKHLYVLIHLEEIFKENVETILKRNILFH